jgi:ubiquinone/menaquinone biosynthesis C-methylase UbiE/uncharacterized protein YbaR (Trm112 family)
MKKDILEILRCPNCSSDFEVVVLAQDPLEIRRGRLRCNGPEHHEFEIEDGIVRFGTGFDHEAVQREIAYENATYNGDQRLVQPDVISAFPETLPQIWPHVRNFGPDFKDLIGSMTFRSSDWVLDVGTAACWTTRLLAQTGARVIALDVNDACYYGLKTADLLFPVHSVYFDRILESMARLPFCNEAIDCICFNASFHHTPDLFGTLQECFRVLKRGGRVAMVNESFVSWRHRFSWASGEMTDLGSHHSISYSDLEKAIKATGFMVQYRLAGHVRKMLEQLLTQRLGAAVARLLSGCPFLLKQLKSIEVILIKSGTTAKDASRTRPRSLYQTNEPRCAPCSTT